MRNASDSISLLQTHLRKTQVLNQEVPIPERDALIAAFMGRPLALQGKPAANRPCPAYSVDYRGYRDVA